MTNIEPIPLIGPAKRMALFRCQAMPSMDGSLVEIVRDWKDTAPYRELGWCRYDVRGRDGIIFAAKESEIELL